MPSETIASQLPAPVSSVRRTRIPSGFSTHCEYVWIPAFLGFKRTIRRFELRHSLPCGESSPRVFQSFAMDQRVTPARTSRYACRRASASAFRCLPSRSKPNGRVLQKGLPDSLRLWCPST